MYRRKQPQPAQAGFIPGSLSDYIPEEHIFKRLKG